MEFLDTSQVVDPKKMTTQEFLTNEKVDLGKVKERLESAISTLDVEHVRLNGILRDLTRERHHIKKKLNSALIVPFILLSYLLGPRS